MCLTAQSWGQPLNHWQESNNVILSELACNETTHCSTLNDGTSRKCEPRMFLSLFVSWRLSEEWALFLNLCRGCTPGKRQLVRSLELMCLSQFLLRTAGLPYISTHIMEMKTVDGFSGRNINDLPLFSGIVLVISTKPNSNIKWEKILYCLRPVLSILLLGTKLAAAIISPEILLYYIHWQVCIWVMDCFFTHP